MNGIKSIKFVAFAKPVLILLMFIKRKIREKTIKISPIKISDGNFLDIMNYSSIDELLLRKEPAFHIDPEKKGIFFQSLKIILSLKINV